MHARTRWVTAALLLQGAGLAAQSSVSGGVREDGSGKPLAGVEVLLEGSKTVTRTDEAGRFRLTAPNGSRVLLFRAIGFRPSRVRVQLAKGDSAVVNAELVREAAQQLDPLETTASPARPRGVGVEAFEERRKLGFGKFLDSTALRRADGRRIADLFRGIPGIRIISWTENENRPDLFELRLVSGRSNQLFGEPCYMSVLFNGSPIYRSSSRSRPPDFRREFNDVSMLQAVEIYPSPAEVPMEYGGQSEECGLVLFWSRQK